MATSRRHMLIGLAGLTAIAWSWQRFAVEKVKLARAPISGLDGWSRVTPGGGISGGGSAADGVFLGLGDTPVRSLPEEALCAVLYRNPGPGRAVAVFTDIHCPHCRVMDPMLASRSELAVTWHELPILGPASEPVARARIAADMLGQGEAFREAIMRHAAFAGPRLLPMAAEAAGLAMAELEDAMVRQTVSDRLTQSRAAAETLGIIGTPALTLGRTLVVGRLSSDQLDGLLETIPAGC